MTKNEILSAVLRARMSVLNLYDRATWLRACVGSKIETEDGLWLVFHPSCKMSSLEFEIDVEIRPRPTLSACWFKPRYQVTLGWLRDEPRSVQRWFLFGWRSAKWAGLETVERQAVRAINRTFEDAYTQGSFRKGIWCAHPDAQMRCVMRLSDAKADDAVAVDDRRFSMELAGGILGAITIFICLFLFK